MRTIVGVAVGVLGATVGIDVGTGVFVGRGVDVALGVGWTVGASSVGSEVTVDLASPLQAATKSKLTNNRASSDNIRPVGRTCNALHIPLESSLPNNVYSTIFPTRGEVAVPVTGRRDGTAPRRTSHKLTILSERL